MKASGDDRRASSPLLAFLPSIRPSAALSGLEGLRMFGWPAVVVYGSFLLFSAVRMPVPAPNEPGYLAKAKHFWDPSFCPGDFFLDSADAHVVFYGTVGWLTRFLTFRQTAIVGRLAAYLLLAVGWTLFASRLCRERSAPVWSAWGFLGLAAAGNLAGEWMVGGVEAKIFSYAFVFWALAHAADRRWKSAGVLFGLAIAFHPVVGGWSFVCASAAGLVVLMKEYRTAKSECGLERSTLGNHRFPDGRTVQDVAIGAVGLLLCALPGLWPVIGLLGGAPKAIQYQADYIHVFYRLSHHLDPLTFSVRQYAGYSVLLLLWLAGSRFARLRQPGSWFDWFVSAAVLVALGGLFAGFGPRPATEMPLYGVRVKFLKLYPFRLADIMLPVAFSLMAVGLLERVVRSARGRWPAVWKAIGWLAFGGAIGFALVAPAPNRNPSRMSAGRLADWKRACRWIAEHTPPDAQFLTPGNSWAFKWYAERAEYVSYKDCPQDAAGIVEWNRRLLYVSRWNKRYYNNGYAVEALYALRRQTPITHIIARRAVLMPIEPVYRNDSWRVYDLTTLPAADSSETKD